MTPLWVTELEINDDTVEEALAECFTLEKNTKSVLKSNVGGWQSPDLGFRDKNKNRNLKTIHLILENLQEQYIPVLKQDLKTNINLILDNSWININRKNNSNIIHVHPYAVLSGVFYLTAENSYIRFEEFDQRSFWLQSIFSEHSAHITITPQKKDLLFFPAWLPHSVGPNNSDQPRVSIAFNIISK